MKTQVRNLLFRNARRFSWRTGRWLYTLARGHTGNDMAVNGEARLQEMVLAAAQSQGRALTVCDVGANLGDWSDMMLTATTAAGVETQLFAFEPIPATADKFEARFLGRSTAPALQRMALSDSAGTAEMAVFSETGGTNSLVFRDDEEIGARVTVPLEAFDAWAEAAGVKQVDLMKIDAEGHDMAVLKGCTEALRTGALKAVQFEYNHRWIAARAFLRDAFELAQPFGYHVGQVRPDGIEIYDQWHFELEQFVEANYALVHPDLLPMLSHSRGGFDPSNIYTPSS